MRQKHKAKPGSAEQTVRDIRRATRKQYSAEEKIRIVLEGLRGEESIAALCRREGIAESLYYSWSKEFLEAGKKRLAGDTARQATSNEVKALRAKHRVWLDGQEMEWLSILAPDGEMKVVQHSPTLRVIGTLSADEVQNLARPKLHKFSEGSIRGHFRSETRRRA